MKNSLTEYLHQNNLTNSFHSAYAKFNSIETTLLLLHDHIIRAISQQQVTGLCLLDLSAAFDTIDHSILLQRLKSWFGINNTVLFWIQSYLFSRSFTVSINSIKSSPFHLLYGVPQGSVLDPLLFILYTTPINHIISRSSVNHKLYADDTQLFLSSSPCNSYKTPFLKSRPGWLPTSFLSTPLKLNFYSLVFLPSSLKLIILLYLCLQAFPSARNLGVTFDSNLSFSDHISYISKTCFAHLRDLRRIRNTLDHTTACIIATSLIHSKLDYCNSLFLNLNCQQTNQLQLMLNSTARAVTKTPKYNHITSHLKFLRWLKGSKSHNAYNTKFSLSHTSPCNSNSLLLF